MIACYPLQLLVFILPLHVVLLLLEGAVLSLLKWQWRPLREIYLPALAICWYERVRLGEMHRAVQAGRQEAFGAFLSAFRFMPQKLSLLLRHGLPRLG